MSLPLRARLDRFLGQVVMAWSLTVIEDAGIQATYYGSAGR